MRDFLVVYAEKHYLIFEEILYNVQLQINIKVYLILIGHEIQSKASTQNTTATN